jgi:hypothetical protein
MVFSAAFQVLLAQEFIAVPDLINLKSSVLKYRDNRSLDVFN